MDEQSQNTDPREARGSYRYNDKGVGMPDFEPEHFRTLSAEESARHQKQMEEELRQEFAQRLSELDSDKGLFRLPKSLQKAGLTALLIITGVLGLFVVVEGVNFAAEIDRLRVPFNYIAGAFALLFALMLVVVIVRLTALFFKLKRVNHVNVRALEILAERQRWQALAEEHAKAARERFVEYLQDYDLSGGKREMQFVALGVSVEDFTRLADARDALIASAGETQARVWLDRFRTDFQALLDEAAQKRTRQYALRVAVGTAVSPIKFIDQLIVLYSGVALAKDMCVLYNLRPGFGQTAVILSRSIVNTYLSGVASEGVDQAADSISEWLGEVSGLLGSGLGRFLGTRTSEGALNGFLVWRLGKRTAALLRLVRVKA